MKNKAIRVSAASIAIAAMFAGAAPALAQTASSTINSNAATRLANIKNRANTDIAARITSLDNLNTRVQAMKYESDAEKAGILSQVQTNTAGLQALQAKIDADTDVTTARTDAVTIFTSFRIYALAIPRGYILAAADRVTEITNLMNTLGTKMQARITADQSAGKDVSALATAMTDMQAKISDANTQSTAAHNGVIDLVPDQGNATVAASNKAALVASRGDLKTATSDLKMARADIKTILQGLRALGK